MSALGRSAVWLASLLLAAPAVATSTVSDSLRNAVATGDCATVVSQTEGASTDNIRLVRGRCQQALGQSQAAVQTLEPIQADTFADLAAATRASALLSLGRTEQALDVLEGRSLPGQAGLELRLTRARAQISLGRSLDARPDLRALLSTSVGDEARYLLAVGGKDRGDEAAAIATFRRVWIDSVHGPWSGKAAEQLEALGAPVPRVDTQQDRDLVVARIEALTKAHRHAEALGLRRALHAVQPQGPITMARACFRGRDYPSAVKWFERALGAPAEASGRDSHLFDYALAMSRTGDYTTAAIIYKRLIAQHPSSHKADTASYKLGYLHADKGEWTQAADAFASHIAARPDSKHLDEALWWTGWGAYVSEDDASALLSWSHLQRARPRSSLVPATMYWTARSMGRRGDSAGERKALERLVNAHPTSGYAWFAAERLGVKHPPRAIVQRPEWPQHLADRPQIRRAEALLEVGLLEPARIELLGLSQELASSDRAGRLALAWALIEAGAYRDGQRLARPFCTAPWRQGDPVAQQACYPRPAASVVEATASRFNVPALVPYGIMTTESALDPSVTSRAGARGLMQLMPDEAKDLHDALYEARPYHPDLLYSAPYNASLGVAELGDKQGKLGDVLDGPDIVAAIAAYNGGEDAVRRWTDALGGKPEFDVFAEQIGYTETRRYVRKVLGTVMAYRHVYGDIEG